MNQFPNNKIKSNKKPIFRTDSLKSRNGSISIHPELTSAYIIANQDSLSIGKTYACGPEENRTPETLMSIQGSNHSGPTAFLLYQKL